MINPFFRKALLDWQHIQCASVKRLAEQKEACESIKTQQWQVKAIKQVIIFIVFSQSMCWLEYYWVLICVLLVSSFVFEQFLNIIYWISLRLLSLSLNIPVHFELVFSCKFYAALFTLLRNRVAPDPPCCWYVGMLLVCWMPALKLFQESTTNHIHQMLTPASKYFQEMLKNIFRSLHSSPDSLSSCPTLFWPWS